MAENKTGPCGAATCANGCAAREHEGRECAAALRARTEPKPDPAFIFGCRAAILTMREAGINDVLIGCIVTEIRSAAIGEERRRLEALRLANPPTHFPHGAIVDAIARSEPAATS